MSEIVPEQPILSATEVLQVRCRVCAAPPNITCRYPSERRAMFGGFPHGARYSDALAAKLAASPPEVSA